MLYFAYGSNMSSRRLQFRTPSATPMGVAALRGYLLKFHKRGDDGSAKCDVSRTRNDNDIVHGVLYQLAGAEIETLDAIEGLGKGYKKRFVSINRPDQTKLDAFTYCATRIDASLSPFCWYKEHVVRGAEEHGLPPDYIVTLKAVVHMDDHDSARVAKELSIYRYAQPAHNTSV